MRKQHSPAFKAQVVQEVLREVRPLSQIASEHGVHPNLLSQWKATALKGLPGVFERGGGQAEAERAAHAKQLEELYAEIGRLTTRVNWLKKKSGLDHV
jgi:transposase